VVASMRINMMITPTRVDGAENHVDAQAVC
jgi:hypothetical protein